MKGDKNPTDFALVVFDGCGDRNAVGARNAGGSAPGASRPGTSNYLPPGVRPRPEGGSTEVRARVDVCGKPAPPRADYD